MLGCVDPVLTLVCAKSYRDPFILSFGRGQDDAAPPARATFAQGTASDHLVMLRAFNGWAEARERRAERAFCDSYGLSDATMRMIDGMRRQLYGQLLSIGVGGAL